ncbi:outer membrane beta-barrel protein [Lacinutrix undariae]
MNKFLFFCALLCTSFSFSQTTFKISGTIIAGDDQSPLESVTVYVERIKDSSLVTYTISDSKGQFSIENESYDEKLNIVVSSIGFQAYTKVFSVKETPINLGVITLDIANALDEVVITSRAPVTIKKDTLEFNVKSFKTKKDATVEDLLKQLPGVEVDEEGKIKVNGKEVSNILVNGKPFFGDDPTITTKNLTKDIIDKIQVVDTKSKSEAFTGEATDGESKTINLTISEDKNKGVFGRVAAGAGTDKRYEAAGMVNLFDNDRRLSILVGGNNINSPGFSFGEIRKMFGGGNSMTTYGNGSFSIDGRSFGGGQGLTKSKNAGLSYADVIGGNTDISINYFHSGSDSNNETISNRENILPESRYFSNSYSKTKSDNDSHSVDTAFDIEVDSTLLINIKPSFKYANSRTSYIGNSSSLNADNVLTNESETSSFVESDARNFNNSLNVTKRFGDKGAYVRFNINNSINKRSSEDYLTSEANIYGEDVTDPSNPNFVLTDQTIRDQYTDGAYDETVFSTGVTYRYPIIAKELFFNFKYEYSNTVTNDVKTTLDRDDVGENYTAFNEDLSTDFKYKDRQSTPGVSISYNKDKFSARIGAEYLFRTLSNDDNLRPEFNIERKFENLQLNSYLNFNISQKTSLYMSYRLSNNAPQLSQLQAFQNVSNPLNIIVGNPNLSPEKNHNIYGGFNSYDYQSDTGFYSYFGGVITNDDVVAKTTIDEDLVRSTTYANVNGSHSLYGGVDYSKKIKLDTIQSVKIGLGGHFNANKRINFNNNVQYASKTNSISPEVYLTYERKGILEIRPAYSINFSKSTYDIDAFEDIDFLSHNLRIRTAFFLPKNFEWRNDVQYSYNPSIADGFQKSAWFWNATLAYSMLDDKATITLKAYDLLNQNTNATRVATQNYIEDRQSTVLERYFMLSFSWKFNSLGKKEKDEGGMIFLD